MHEAQGAKTVFVKSAAAEISHSNRKYAFALLDANRGKWEVKEGKIVFLDQRTARMYEYPLAEGLLPARAVRPNHPRQIGHFLNIAAL